MIENDDVERYQPPMAPIDMPYQVVERRPEAHRSLLAMLKQLVARRAPHE